MILMDCVGILELLNRYIHLPVIDDNVHETSVIIPPARVDAFN